MSDTVSAGVREPVAASFQVLQNTLQNADPSSKIRQRFQYRTAGSAVSSRPHHCPFSGATRNWCVWREFFAIWTQNRHPPSQSLGSQTGRKQGKAGTPRFIVFNRELPAGDAHVAVDSGVPVAPVNHEIMSLGFARDSGSDCILEVIVALGTTQGRSEVGGVLLA
jgi:hypothetical protein